MGGVNHCSIHCCLAKFRGLMCQSKYGAVIGYEKNHSLETVTGRISWPITAPYLPWYIKPRNFAKRQCKHSG